MTDFVDPRTNPQPRAGVILAEMAQSTSQLDDLHQLCREGKLYEVEAWIRAGQPLQANIGFVPRGRKIPTAPGIALETGQQALTALLLCNGYQLERELRSSFDIALEVRRRDLVDLLFTWGADPHRATLPKLFATYDTVLVERFYAAGVGFTQGHVLGETLGGHSSNKPLFGFAKRHCQEDPGIQMELNIALVRHAEAGHLKGVHLCLWAGADPHARIPGPESCPASEASEGSDEEDRVSGETAVEAAARGGHAEILRLLRPDPTRDRWDALYQMAQNGPTAAVLAAIAPPRDVGAVLDHQTFWLDDYWHGFDWEPVGVVEQVFKAGGRWIESPPRRDRDHPPASPQGERYETSCRHAPPRRRRPLQPRRAARAWADPRDSTTPDLDRSASFPRGDHPTWGGGPHQVPGARKVASKLGIADPKEPKLVPRVVEIGQRHGRNTTIRLTRRIFYERVWSEPLESLAKVWGLSGRGLAKACERAAVPVPSRGYWAKVQHGQTPTRPPLGEAPGTVPAEIMIHVPPTAS